MEPENLSRMEGSLAYPSYPGGSNFSCISLQNLANRLQEKQWVGSARRLTGLAGTPPFDDRVNLLPRATILHINTLACPAGLTRSTRDSACASPVVSSWLGQIGQFLFLILTLVKLNWLGGWPSFRGLFFSKNFSSVWTNNEEITMILLLTWGRRISQCMKYLVLSVAIAGGKHFLFFGGNSRSVSRISQPKAD